MCRYAMMHDRVFRNVLRQNKMTQHASDKKQFVGPALKKPTNNNNNKHTLHGLGPKSVGFI